MDEITRRLHALPRPWRTPGVTYHVTLEHPGFQSKEQFPGNKDAAWAYAQNAVRYTPGVWKAAVACFDHATGQFIEAEYGTVYRTKNKSRYGGNLHRT